MSCARARTQDIVLQYKPFFSLSLGRKWANDMLGVDSQIWHLLRPTGQTGQVCTVRVELDFFVKSPHVILLVKGYIFPGL